MSYRQEHRKGSPRQRAWASTVAAVAATMIVIGCSGGPGTSPDPGTSTPDPGTATQEIVYPEREELLAAFNYLNAIRADPAAHDDAIVSEYNARNSRNATMDLSDVPPRRQLLWNETLAAVAQAKCEDMFDRDYFDHVDPDGEGINIKMHRAGYRLPSRLVADRSSNRFESLAGVYTPYRDSSADGWEPTVEALAARSREHIQVLIVDEGFPSLGHRIHLLGMNAWHSRHRDIGIGFAHRINFEGFFSSYMCVVIAHRPS